MTGSSNGQSNGHKSSGLQSLLDELPLDRFKDEAQDALKAMGEKALGNVTQRITGATDSLTDMADTGGFTGSIAKGGAKAWAEGDSPVAGALKGGLTGVKDKVKQALPGGGGGGGG